MAQRSADPTDSPEINSVLSEVLVGARSILGKDFAGMYLDGSLAIGGFDPDKSDLYFVGVNRPRIT